MYPDPHPARPPDLETITRGTTMLLLLYLTILLPSLVFCCAVKKGSSAAHDEHEPHRHKPKHEKTKKKRHKEKKESRKSDKKNKKHHKAEHSHEHQHSSGSGETSTTPNEFAPPQIVVGKPTRDNKAAPRRITEKARDPERLSNITDGQVRASNDAMYATLHDVRSDWSNSESAK